MGRKNEFVKDRQRGARRDRERRDAHAKRKAGKSADEMESKRIAVPDRQPHIPSREDVDLLLKNPALAARLPKPCSELSHVLQAFRVPNAASAAAHAEEADGLSFKRARKNPEGATMEQVSRNAAKAVAKALIGDDSVLIELAFDECGSRLVNALMRSLAHFEMHDDHSKLLSVFLKISDDGAQSLFLTMAEHHFARSVVWAAIDTAGERDLTAMFDHIAPLANAGAHVTAPAASSSSDAASKKGKKSQQQQRDLQRIHEMVLHRHGAITLQKFIARFPSSRDVITAAVLSEGSGASGSTFRDIVKSPIGAPVVQALAKVSDDGRLTHALFTAAREAEGGIADILADPKRGPRVIMSMLGEVPSAGSAQIAQTVFDELGAAELVTMCKDSKRNFLLQKLLQHATADVQKTLFTAVAAHSFVELCTHGVGVHVAIAFVSLNNDDVRRSVVKAVAPHIVDLVHNRHGGLFIRKLVEHAGSGSLNLMQLLEKDIPSLIYDGNGNLVVQQLLEHHLAGRPAAERLKFFERFIKADIVQMCQHQFAAHVIVKLFDVLDGQTTAEMAAALRPHVLTLVQHVNGRFVVDRLIGPFKDIRDLIAARFVELSQLKGTQHVLVRLYEVSDKKARQQLLKLLQPVAMQLACHQNATLVIQKLVQMSKSGSINDEGLFAAEIAKSLNMNQLRQDFFGKFVAKNL